MPILAPALGGKSAAAPRFHTPNPQYRIVEGKALGFPHLNDELLLWPCDNSS